MHLPTFSILCTALAALPLVLAQQTYPIVGAKSGINPRTGETPARRNINDLYAEAGPQWDLYIGALLAMQEANETDPLSYFQIAAIHGQPYMGWAGGGPQTGSARGFCPHNEALFGSWHRAYLSLFEQVLVEQAQKIAETYPRRQRQRYMEAADRLRAPYWDWASDHRLPPATVQQTVRINRPAAMGLIRRVNVRNPLAGYTYPRSAQEGAFGRFSGVNATERCTQPGRRFPDSANQALAEQGLRDRVYTSLIRARSWAEISTTASGRNSLEGPHGNVHVQAACGNDFVYLETAAYEPLFMLHHANVDRLLAYWQALNYENFSMQFEYRTNGLFASPPGTVMNARSPVAPFEGERGPLNSEDVASIRDWGYTYEPLRYWDQSPGQLKNAVTRVVNDLYGPRRSGGSTKRSTAGAGSKRGQKPRRKVEKEYFVKMEVERSDLDLPAVIDVYVKGLHAGSVAILGMPKAGRSFDEIPLQHVLEEAGLESADATKTLAILDKYMEILITKPNGKTIPISSVPSLKIEVEDVDVMLPASDNELPEFGKSHSRPALLKTLKKLVDSKLSY